MKETKIIYSKKFPYAPYLNESISLEAEVEINEIEDVQEALQMLREAAEESFKTAHPQIKLETPVEEKKSEEEITQDTTLAISLCNTLEELREYNLLKNRNKAIFDIYKRKEYELYNK